MKVLIPEISGHIAVDWVARSFYSPLLEAGVKIWLYQSAIVHARTATADGVWITAGTANTDRLSMTGNYEVSLEAYSPDLTAQVEQVFRNDLGDARQPTLTEWEEHPWLAHIIKGVLRPLGSIL